MNLASLSSLYTDMITIDLTKLSFQIIGAAIIFVVFWLLSRAAAGVLRKLLSRRRSSPDLANLVAQVTGVFILLFGIVSALGTIGIDTGAMIAGLGLTGFALGFALRDAISNFLAGFMILLYEPFRREDLIKVGENEGTVVEINLRYTVLDAGHQRVLIPNSQLLTNAVIVKRGGNPEEGTAVDS